RRCCGAPSCFVSHVARMSARRARHPRLLACSIGERHMRQMRFWILLLAAVGCGGGDDTLADAGAQPDSAVEHDAAVGTDAAQVEIVQYEEMFDAESNTTYYLTRVAHEDGRGELVRLRHAHAIEQEGESVPAFAARM